MASGIAQGRLIIKERDVTGTFGGVAVDDVFVGRGAELARLAEVVARVRQGQPWLVTVEGDSGVGKTALVRHFLASCADLTVLWAQADPSESDLDYGIVEQLLRPVKPGLMARYPLLEGDLVRSSAFAVGAELLGIVGDQQRDGPVAMVVDDVQWADNRSVEALSFMLRRLSADAVLVLVVVRGERGSLGERTRRMLVSIQQRARLSLPGLHLTDVGPLATALGAGPLTGDAIKRLYDRTGGHTLYLQTVLSEKAALSGTWGSQATVPELGSVPSSLAAAIGDQLALLPTSTRSLVEMLAVANVRVPLVLLGHAAEEASPSTAIQPALTAGLVDLWSPGPSGLVAIRHALQRDAIYSGIPAGRRRELHARAVAIVDDSAAWAHRVAALDRPDEALARQLERLAADEAGQGHLTGAGTHLLWASDISPLRDDRERRLLTAVIHLMLVDEARGMDLLDAVENCAPSPLRGCVLGTIAFARGQLVEAERRFDEAFRQAREDPASELLAAMIANRLAGTYALLGDGEKVVAHGRWALNTGCLDAAADSQTRTLVAIGASQLAGPRAGLAEIGHVDPDPTRVEPVHVDGLSYRGVFHLLAGDLANAVDDLTNSLRMARRGATITLGLRVYVYLGMAQYLSGAWDDVLLTSEQAFSAAAVHARRYELPMLHLIAGCVPAGRGATVDAERHARLAEEAAAELEYSQETLYARMARALVCQASGDYAGMAGVLSHWHDETVLDDRTRTYGVLWRPLLVEGLIGAERPEEAAVALERLQSVGSEIDYLQPALAWLEGWLSEVSGEPERAAIIYQRGDGTAIQDSPVYTARLLLAHGRLLRRTGQRRAAVARLRRANDLFGALGAAPFVAQTEEELKRCGLPVVHADRHSALTLTERESEVAHLIGRGMSNSEIGGELFITQNTVEYHLRNIYDKCGVRGRRQLRSFLGHARLTPGAGLARPNQS